MLLIIALVTVAIGQQSGTKTLKPTVMVTFGTPNGNMVDVTVCASPGDKLVGQGKLSIDAMFGTDEFGTLFQTGCHQDTVTTEVLVNEQPVTADMVNASNQACATFSVTLPGSGTFGFEGSFSPNTKSMKKLAGAGSGCVTVTIP